MVTHPPRRHGAAATLPPSSDVEDFPQAHGNRAVVRIGWHHIAHVRPPFFTDGRIRDGRPACLILDLRVAEKLPGFLMQEDAVIVDAVVLENLRLQT
jgi:hypothetical protein